MLKDALIKSFDRLKANRMLLIPLVVSLSNHLCPEGMSAINLFSVSLYIESRHFLGNHKTRKKTA